MTRRPARAAGAPSALQMALHHPDRVSALVLLVPLAHKPPAEADSARPLRRDPFSCRRW